MNEEIKKFYLVVDPIAYYEPKIVLESSVYAALYAAAINWHYDDNPKALEEFVAAAKAIVLSEEQVEALEIQNKFTTYGVIE